METKGRPRNIQRMDFERHCDVLETDTPSQRAKKVFQRKPYMVPVRKEEEICREEA